MQSAFRDLVSLDRQRMFASFTDVIVTEKCFFCLLASNEIRVTFLRRLHNYALIKDGSGITTKIHDKTSLKPIGFGRFHKKKILLKFETV